MSTEQTWEIKSSSLDETLALGEKIGKRLRGGEVIELASDLGGGKTSFVKGIAKGAGSKDIASSPSFTISNQYQAGDLTLHHFDFYRLHDAGILKDEIADILQDNLAVIIIEWGEIVHDVLPEDRLRISFKNTGESSRTLVVSCPPALKYLVE
jgi:tRNA threonylcarbamoyladenosine biosynthesis protein TsaE